MAFFSSFDSEFHHRMITQPVYLIKLCVLVVTAAKAAASTASDVIAVGLALASISIYWWSWPSALFKPKAWKTARFSFSYWDCSHNIKDFFRPRDGTQPLPVSNLSLWLWRFVGSFFPGSTMAFLFQLKKGLHLRVRLIDRISFPSFASVTYA